MGGAAAFMGTIMMCGSLVKGWNLHWNNELQLWLFTTPLEGCAKIARRKAAAVFGCSLGSYFWLWCHHWCNYQWNTVCQPNTSSTSCRCPRGSMGKRWALWIGERKSFDTFFYTACHTNVDCNFSKHHHHQLRWPTFSCAPAHHPNRQFHSYPNAHDAFLGSKRWWLLPPNQRIVWAWFWFKGGLVQYTKKPNVTIYTFWVYRQE